MKLTFLSLASFGLYQIYWFRDGLVNLFPLRRYSIRRNHMLAFFVPGAIEIIIIGVIVLVPIAVIVALVVVRTRSQKPSGSNPNLRPCPDCGRFVSLRATACPQCGCPLQAQQ